MTKIRCAPDKKYWGDEIPGNWEYGFEEAHLSIDKVAAELRNIMLLLGYMPCQVAEAFHPELVKDWGYDLAKDDDN